MEWITYLLAALAIALGLVLGFLGSGLWIIAVPRLLRRRRTTRACLMPE